MSTVIPTWNRLSDNLGTNPGGWYRDEHNDEWYVKQYLSEEQAFGEFLAGMIYERFNIPVANTWMIFLDGKWTIASKKLEGVVLSRTKRNGHIVRNIKELRASKDVIDGFIIDCWLSNYDATGLGNILRATHPRRETKDGIAYDGEPIVKDYRIDNGGCMFWSAKGNHRKDYFWENPMACPDLDDFRDREFGNGRPGHVFCKIDDETIRLQAQRFALVFDDMTIDELVKETEFPSIEYEMKTMFYLQARRDAILDWAKV